MPLRYFNCRTICTTIAISIIIGGAGWMYRMERLGTMLVHQMKSSSQNTERNEKSIESNSKAILKVMERSIQHEVRINVIEKKKD